MATPRGPSNKKDLLLQQVVVTIPAIRRSRNTSSSAAKSAETAPAVVSPPPMTAGRQTSSSAGAPRSKSTGGGQKLAAAENNKKDEKMTSTLKKQTSPTSPTAVSSKTNSKRNHDNAESPVAAPKSASRSRRGTTTKAEGFGKSDDTDLDKAHSPSPEPILRSTRRSSRHILKDDPIEFPTPPVSIEDEGSNLRPSKKRRLVSSIKGGGGGGLSESPEENFDESNNNMVEQQQQQEQHSYEDAKGVSTMIQHLSTRTTDPMSSTPALYDPDCKIDESSSVANNNSASNDDADFYLDAQLKYEEQLQNNPQHDVMFGSDFKTVKSESDDEGGPSCDDDMALQSVESPPRNEVVLTVNSFCEEFVGRVIQTDFGQVGARAGLFKHIPPGLPRQPPVVVLDNWVHGQLVWWNRFLANRKKTQGTAVGNFVGRVVDLESEWFPNTDLVSIKIRLKSLAAAMGRRSVFVQSFDEMRYLTLPPRAISAFPDPDPQRHKELLTGLRRAGSLAAKRGLRIATMLSTLRKGLNGETNSMLELELLDLCMTSDYGTTDEELTHLDDLSVWDLLKNRGFKGASAASNRRASPKLQHVPSPSSSRRKSTEELDDGTFAKKYKTKFKEFEPRRATRREDVMMLPCSLESNLSSASQTVEHCRILCQSITLKRSDLLFLLRGVPITLLSSSTGIPLPADIPASTLKIIEMYYKSNISKILGLRLNVTNSYLHRLFRCAAFRIPVKKYSSAIEQQAASSSPPPPPDPQLSGSAAQGSIIHHSHRNHQHNTNSNSNNQHMNQQIKQQQHLAPSYGLQQQQQQAAVVSPSGIVYSQQQNIPYLPSAELATYRLGLSFDHFHKDKASNNPMSDPYVVATPFPCVHSMLWKGSYKCLRATIRAICLTDVNEGMSYCSVTLNQISDLEVNQSEIDSLVNLIMTQKRVTVRDLERRLGELNMLREISAYIQSLTDDISSALDQTNGYISNVDERYFETSLLDLLRRIR